MCDISGSAALPSSSLAMSLKKKLSSFSYFRLSFVNLPQPDLRLCYEFSTPVEDLEIIAIVSRRKIAGKSSFLSRLLRV